MNVINTYEALWGIIKEYNIVLFDISENFN